jgi:nicotinate phosphoribosyltransferase
MIKDIYKPSLALLTDLYELTMAYGYWKSGIQDKETVWHVSFRRNPFQGGFTIACGLAPVLEYLREFRFDDSDIDYLGSLTGNDGKPLFTADFLDYLAGLEEKLFQRRTDLILKARGINKS